MLPIFFIVPALYKRVFLSNFLKEDQLFGNSQIRIQKTSLFHFIKQKCSVSRELSLQGNYFMIYGYEGHFDSLFAYFPLRDDAELQYIF